MLDQKTFENRNPFLLNFFLNPKKILILLQIKFFINTLIKMVSLPPNQETMKVFSLDDKLDPNFERPVIRQEMKKGEEVKVSKFQMLKKKFADVSSALKTKVLIFLNKTSTVLQYMYFNNIILRLNQMKKQKRWMKRMEIYFQTQMEIFII